MPLSKMYGKIPLILLTLPVASSRWNSQNINIRVSEEPKVTYRFLTAQGLATPNLRGVEESTVFLKGEMWGEFSNFFFLCFCIVGLFL